MAPTQKISAMVQHEREELLIFLERMRDGIDKRLSTRLTLYILIETFRQVAQVYIKKAEKIIDESGNTETQKKRDYDHVLSHLRQHALLLGDLIRYYTVEIFSTSRRQDFQRAFILLSHRLRVLDMQQSPILLLPILSENFRYTHFTYMNELGFISIPLEMSIDKPSKINHLGVLWHEVAGHAMAVYRKTQPDLLLSWANNLHKKLEDGGVLTNYLDIYRESVISNIPKRKELEKIPYPHSPSSETLFDPIQTLYESRIVHKNVISQDIEWQITWLLEFLEDLYFFTIIKDLDDKIQKVALKSIFAELLKKYPASHIGDPMHPPPDLRLSVLIAYLGKERNSNFLQQLNIPINYNSLAKPIADYCVVLMKKIVKDDKRHLEIQKIKQTEKELAKEILSDSPDWFNLRKVLREIELEGIEEQEKIFRMKLAERFAEKEITKQEQKILQQLQRRKKLTKKELDVVITLAQHLSKNLNNEINDPKNSDLQKLLQIKLNYDDPNAPGHKKGVGSGPPPPP